MGRNGSGKSSLLWALQGTGARFAGDVDVRRGDAVVDPAQQPAAQRRELVGLLPQNAADLLYLETVAEELAAGDGGDGSCREILDSLAPGLPGVVLLDEPTRGLDYAAKRVLARTVRDLAADGHAVLVASHDVEFVAQAADDALVLAEGEVVSRGPARTVVAESPAFAPQVTKVLGPPWLRVDEVVDALETA
jgi:energy-coupling factor transport system ATP-binding protein